MAASSGLMVGIEGPLCHIGAIIACLTTQGGKGVRLKWAKMATGFDNEIDKRDFMAAGAAAGITAAFGAPLAGVLFSWEGAASHWSSRQTLQCVI